MTYKERVEKGVCGRCGKRKPLPGLKLCEVCSLSNKLSAAEYRKRNKEALKARDKIYRDRFREKEEREMLYCDRLRRALQRHDLDLATKIILKILPIGLSEKMQKEIRENLSSWEDFEDES